MWIVDRTKICGMDPSRRLSPILFHWYHFIPRLCSIATFSPDRECWHEDIKREIDANEVNCLWSDETVSMPDMQAMSHNIRNGECLVLVKSTFLFFCAISGPYAGCFFRGDSSYTTKYRPFNSWKNRPPMLLRCQIVGPKTNNRGIRIGHHFL